MPDRIISVLLVDDHSLVRHGFRRMLEDSPDIQVIAEASDGHDAVQIAGKLHPDVVIMDFALPSMNGAVATRNLMKVSPATRVLIVSMHSELVYFRTCMNAGARGYLLKNAMELELVDAVKQIADGQKFVDSRLALDVRSQVAEVPSLTTRELEVLQLIVHGKSNKDIAVVLGVSSNTVGVHRANIMQTLGIHNTAELVVYAIRNGLVSIA